MFCLIDCVVLRLDYNTFGAAGSACPIDFPFLKVTKVSESLMTFIFTDVPVP